MLTLQGSLWMKRFLENYFFLLLRETLGHCFLSCELFFTKQWGLSGSFHLMRSSSFGSVLNMTRTGLSRDINPAESSCDSRKKLTMSERCNLKALTAALCCFNHKNAVISGKVRETGCCSSLCIYAIILYKKIKI